MSDGLDKRLAILHRQVAIECGYRIDMYYYQGYGALFVPKGYPLTPSTVIFAFPDNAIQFGWGESL